MPRREPDASATSWQDIAECVPAWEGDYGVRVEARIVFEARLSLGAYVEVVLTDATTVGGGPEILRTRHAFPARRGSGHAGAVLHAIFSAFAELENNPWLWPTKKRRAVTGE